jgi:hypothetical protein
LGVLSYRAIRGLIDSDTAVSSRLPVQAELIAHDNLRGPTYFR